MIGNNIFALFFHLLFIVLFCLFGFLTMLSGHGNDYPHVTFPAIYSISCFILGNYLSVQTSRLMNFLSVSSILIVGVVISIVVWLFMGMDSAGYLGLYAMMSVYVCNFFPVISFRFGFIYDVILTIPLPTLLIWLGLECKAYRINKAQNSGNNYQG